MGSSDGGAGGNGRWWENPKLSPSDLRQHAETWSLADDAAMATLLQGISQRLVSRTHEVEGALERSLEDTDRIITTIDNTNNAFHMLANTQFIENRTYQDDADIVREKKEVPEKQAVTEEEILDRCKTAIADGLNLVASSYECHEIQDSDSDDDDSPSSPVPVYALINPYEKPLPYIIGSEGFLSDDKVGLEVSSSEENSRMTFSPEDTESEGELEDETDSVTLQRKAIPASSSRAVDEDSDSEWSADDDTFPNKPNAVVSKPGPLHLSSDDEDMFVPSSRTSEKVGNIFSEKNNARTGISTNKVNKRTDLDSDSEDDGLFGKQQRSSGLLDGLKYPSNSQTQRNTKNSDSPSPAGPVKLPGVENVRAMPDATPIIASDAVKSKEKTNLFASDSDDEGDLFSSKHATSGKATNNISHSQGKAPVSGSGGLFSSDEDSPLFSGITPVQEPRNIKEGNEDPPSQPKESARKVPVGGVSIFGTAITSALRQQQLSDEEASDDETHTTNNIKDTQPPPSKPDDRNPQKPANVKLTVKGGLFDSDEEENLFDTLVRKPLSVTSATKKTPSGIEPSLSENKHKTENKIHKDNESTSNVSRKETTLKSSSGLFSDEEDNFFGIPSTTKNKEVSSAGETPQLEKSPKVIPNVTKTEEEAVKASRPASLFTPPNYQSPAQPVNISEPSKSVHSLFSSPSDDDDDLFSSISKPVHKVSHASPFMTHPPPLPPQSTNTHTESSSKKVPQPGNHDDANVSSTMKGSHQENKKESPFTNLFSSTSDEDIFFSVTTQKNSLEAPKPQPSEEKGYFSESKEEPEVSTNNITTSHSNISGEIFDSPVSDTFKPVSQPSNDNSEQSEVIDQSIRRSEELSDPFLEKKTDICDDTSKNDNIFGSTDDLFSVPEKSDKPGDSSNKKGLHDLLEPDVEQETKSTISTMVSDDTSKTSNLGLQNEGNSNTISKITSSSQKEPDPLSTQETKENVSKPPVGGVALFGGKELVAQINKRRTLYEPTEEEITKIKNDIFDDIQDSVSISEGDSKTLMFDDSDDDLFSKTTGYSEKSTGNSIYRQSPPLLPEEVEKNSMEKKSEKVVPPKSKSLDLNSEPQKPVDVDRDLKKPKPDKPEAESEEEIKPRKKPPIGGVSMFGGGGIGGSELFAKVLQRKSMLAPESDSEEDTPTESREITKPTTSSEDIVQSKPVLPRTPLSPISPLSPVFIPGIRESKSGGEESCISFDDPATHNNVLSSVNKTRVKGSIKRRPPSRAHRQGGGDNSNPSDAQDSSTSTQTPSPSLALPSNLEHTNIKLPDTSNAEPVQSGEVMQHTSADKVERKIPRDIENNEKESTSTDIQQTVISHKDSNFTEGIKAVGVSSEKNEEVAPVNTKNDKDDMFSAPKSALSISKTSSKQSSSLFGGSDSDEELFGGVKQTQNTKKSISSSGAKSVIKIASKSSRSHSLFEDDDDDGSIFSPNTQVKEITSGPSRNVSVNKPKGNLKQSTEPFEDPLLGNMKK